MCWHLRSQPPAEGFDRVVIPGDRGQKKMLAAREAGWIEIDDTLVVDLARLNR